MAITREFLETRIANLTAARVKAMQEAQTQNVLAHTLHGAIQDAQHMLAVFDGKVPATGEVPTDTGNQVKTDVVMDAEIGRKTEEIQ